MEPIETKDECTNSSQSQKNDNRGHASGTLRGVLGKKLNITEPIYVPANSIACAGSTKIQHDPDMEKGSTLGLN